LYCFIQKHDIVKQLQRNQFASDSALVEIYKQMGVDTHFQGNKMTLVKQSDFKPENLNLDLNNT
jgi:3-phosphoshikimate 1-carboxyvinyltransferase